MEIKTFQIISSKEIYFKAEMERRNKILMEYLFLVESIYLRSVGPSELEEAHSYHKWERINLPTCAELP
jgi:hypothetical protein